ncbi:MAG TPA: AAA family ATPase, partial [Prochlorococcaceae cyanobacterium AMR_MDS_5431]|nr:AAA family ATPase [Prochlorococcaceae cyanobacterium AMR_MDS_5431]
MVRAQVVHLTQNQANNEDLAYLLNILPASIVDALTFESFKEPLLEIVLDLGRIPQARYKDYISLLGDKPITRAELTEVIKQLGPFGDDNRVGIESTLHRISALRNRCGSIIGLTCRIGRATRSNANIVRDILDSGQSILIMGRPGIGKTTTLRDIARILADELNRRVIVIDTSNEIAGDGDIPHPSIGQSRRIQVPNPTLQHRMMIEAVENHTPEVIIIDEIGTEMEAQAARTIAERGIQLIATAHGNGLVNLIKNPMLSDLIGGIQSVILSDDEAQRRSTQKTVLERATKPTFHVAVEMHSSFRWSIHTNVAQTVDIILQSYQPKFKENKLTTKSQTYSSESRLNKKITVKDNPSWQSSVWNACDQSSDDFQSQQKSQNLSSDTVVSGLCIYSSGIDYQLLNELICLHEWPIILVSRIEKATIILALPHSLSGDSTVRHHARNHRIPILVVKS